MNVFHWIWSWGIGKRSSHLAGAARPRFERLEPRLFLSADPLGLGAECPMEDVPLDQVELVVSLIPGDQDRSVPEQNAGPRQDSLAVPVHESQPGAAHILFLDFDGHDQAAWGSFSNVQVPAFQGSADDIMRVIEVVSDDFSPFDVNVSTVEPEPAALVDGAGWRAVIGGDASSHGYGQDALGVAYMNDFFHGDDPNVVFVFAENFSHVQEIGNTTSHEVGHTVGLEHYWLDGNGNGDYDTEENTNPTAIMSTPDYGVNRETWSRGLAIDNTEMTQDQDDVQILGQTLGWHADQDGGDSRENASRIVVADNGRFEIQGVIEQLDDSDTFYFDCVETGAGTFTVEMDPIAANLDVELAIYDSLHGSALAIANPEGDLGATLTVSLDVGRYFLRITSNGDAGEVGRYTVRAQTPVAKPPEVMALMLSEDTGADPSDKVTHDTRPTVNILFSEPVMGTDADVQVVDPQGTPLILSQVSGWGSRTVSVTFAQALPLNGEYQVVLKHTIIDRVGLALHDNTDQIETFILDTVAPVVSMTSLATSDTSPALTGTVDDPAARIWVTVNNKTYEAGNMGNGQWTLSQNTINPSLSAGIYNVAVEAVDLAGNSAWDLSIDELTIESFWSRFSNFSLNTIFKPTPVIFPSTKITLSSGLGNLLASWKDRFHFI